MDLLQLAQKLSGASLATLLILILIGGWKKVWVFGYQLNEMEAQVERMRLERDGWKELALKATGLAENSVTIAERRAQK